MKDTGKIPIIDPTPLKKKEMIQFDTTINLGHLLTIGSVIVSLVAVLHKIDVVQLKVDLMWDQFARDHNIMQTISFVYRVGTL